MSRRYPSTYEAPVWRLLKYAVIVWLFGVAVGVAVTLVANWTNWWQQLGTATLNFHMVNPWFLLIYGGFGTVAVLGYRRQRNAEKKRREFREEQGLHALDEKRRGS